MQGPSVMERIDIPDSIFSTFEGQRSSLGEDDGETHGFIVPCSSEGDAPRSFDDAGATTELPEPLVLDGTAKAEGKRALQFKKRSCELMSHARSVLAHHRSEARVARLESEQEAQESGMKLVAATLPGVAPLLGKNDRTKRLIKQSDAEPRHFAALCFALFLSLRQKGNFGVNRKRLAAFGCTLILLRQKRALACLLARIRSALADCASKPAEVVMNYSHEWDDTRSYFARFTPAQRFQYRQGKSGVHVQNMVQSGALRVDVGELSSSDGLSLQEEWL